MMTTVITASTALTEVRQPGRETEYKPLGEAEGPEKDLLHPPEGPPERREIGYLLHGSFHFTDRRQALPAFSLLFWNHDPIHGFQRLPREARFCFP
jgi:hypothetical protein